MFTLGREGQGQVTKGTDVEHQQNHQRRGSLWPGQRLTTDRETEQKQQNNLEGELKGVPATGLAPHRGLSTKEEPRGVHTPCIVEKKGPSADNPGANRQQLHAEVRTEQTQGRRIPRL